MEITKPARECFKIKGKRAIILINPPLALKNLTAQIIITASKDEIPEVRGEPVIIFAPGEYEIRGVRILGAKEKEKTLYKIEMDGLSLLYLDRVQEKISEELVALLNDTDILFLPVSKVKVASALISQLEPLVAIPVEETGIEDFLKEEGVETVERLGKLVIAKGELPEERKIVVLK